MNESIEQGPKMMERLVVVPVDLDRYCIRARMIKETMVVGRTYF